MLELFYVDNLYKLCYIGTGTTLKGRSEMEADIDFRARHSATVLLQEASKNPASYTDEQCAQARVSAYDSENGFVSFGDMARLELGQQCQYASRYVYGVIQGYANLGDGLRFENYEIGRSNYHSLRIHLDDIPEFIRRYREQ